MNNKSFKSYEYCGRKGKTKAVNSCNANGLTRIDENNSTLATISGYYYPANVDKRKLKEDWYLILNDNLNKKLIIFKVSANSIAEDDVLFRTDASRKNIFRFYIKAKDPSFTEEYSKTKLNEYYIKTIMYN